MHMMGSFVTRREILGDVVPLESIERILQGINLRQSLNILVSFCLALDVHARDGADLQRYLVERIFPPSVRDLVMPRLAGPAPRAVCCKQQLLSLMKLTFLNCPSGEGAVLEDNSEAKGLFYRDCLLGILDHLNGEAFVRGLENLPSIEARKRKLEELTLRLETLQVQDQYRYSLPRYYDLLIGLPRRSPLREMPNAVDFAALFTEATALDLSSYFYLALTLISHYQRIDFKNRAQSWQGILVHPDQWFPSKVQPPEAQAFWSALSLDTNGFRNALRAEPASMEHLFHNFLVFETKPLYVPEPSRCLPLDLTFFQQKTSSGAFWAIDECLRSTDMGRWDMFRQFFGEVFQCYMSNLLAEAVTSSSRLVPRLFLDLRYGKPEKRASDAILLDFADDVHAVLIDAKGKRPKKISTCIEGNIDSYEEDIEKLAVKAAEQIDRVIADFQRGEFALGHFTYQDIRQFYPLVVAPQSVPQLLLLGQKLEDTVMRTGLLAQPRVAPLQVISIEELEILTGLMASKGYCLSALLRGRLASKDYRYMHMKDFLIYEVFGGRSIPPNERLIGKVEAITAEAQRYLGLRTNRPPHD
jgi:hypothetical protein